MTTIKGPIHIKGTDIGQFLNKENIKVKLPFTATGWNSTKTPINADMKDIKVVKDKPVKEEEKTTNIEVPIVDDESSTTDKQVPDEVKRNHTKAELSGLDFKELKKLGNDIYKVNGRGKDELIRDILRSQKTGYKELD